MLLLSWNESKYSKESMTKGQMIKDKEESIAQDFCTSNVLKVTKKTKQLQLYELVVTVSELSCKPH